VHLPQGRLTAAGLATIAGAWLAAAPAFARPELVPLSPGVAIPAQAAARLGHVALNATGTRLAYVHGFDPLGQNHTGLARLFAEDLDGTDRVQLTTDDAVRNPEAAAFTLDGAVIYFTAEAGAPAVRELFRVPAAGGAVERLTTRDEDDDDPIRKVVPAPDGGAWFAVGSDLLTEELNLTGGRRVLYHVAADGTITRRSNPATNPSRDAEVMGISVDGALLAFSARDPALGGQRTIRPWILNTATGNIASVGPAIGAAGIEGVFSPINQRVVMSSDGDYLGTNGSRTPQIFRADIDGGTFNQLTQATNNGALRPGTNADGTIVTFESAAPLQIGEPTGTSRVYVLGPTGPIRRIASGWEPAIALDGSRLAWSADNDSVGDNGDGSFEVFSAKLDGTDKRQHTRYAAAQAEDPTVSADGQRIVFAATGNFDGGNADGSREIWAVQSNGTGLHRLTDTAAPEGCREPAISPDGEWVAFASNADLAGDNGDGNEEIFRIRFDGTALVQITDTSTGSNRRPRLSTDGRRLFFVSTADILTGATMGSGRLAFWREVTGSFQLLSPASDRAIDALYINHEATRAVLLSTASMEGRNPTHAIRIFAAATDGTLFRGITVTGGLTAQGLGFSGNGEWVAAGDIAGQLVLVPWAGGQADTVLSLTGVFGGYPSVNADASRLSFISLGTGMGFKAGDIYQFQRGSDPEPQGMLDHAQPLPPVPPMLSANGTTIAFLMTGVDTLNPDGSREVFAVRVPGTAVRWLDMAATLEGPEVVVAWRADADGDHALFRVMRAPSAGGPWTARPGAIERAGNRYTWRDADDPAARWYRVEAVDRFGRVDRSLPVTPIGDAGGLRLSVGPNPSRGETAIRLVRNIPGRNRVDIIAVTGRLVRRLVDETVAAGVYDYTWTGEDESGNRVAPGVYYVRVAGLPARPIVRVR
jgi:Tol biopolymer transport system component